MEPQDRVEARAWNPWPAPPGRRDARAFLRRCTRVRHLACVGNLNWDEVHVAGRRVHEGLGGSATNTAVMAAKLARAKRPAPFETVTIVGLLGDDALEARIRAAAANHPVDLARVRAVPGHASGHKIVHVAAGGERTITNAPRERPPVVTRLPGHVKEWMAAMAARPAHAAVTWVHVKQDWPVVEALVRALVDAPARPVLSLDFSALVTTRHPVRLESLQGVFDVLFGNEAELAGLARRLDVVPAGSESSATPSITATATAVTRVLVPRLLFVKQGPRGALGCLGGTTRDSWGHVATPSLDVRVVDTTGAGDTFNAGAIVTLAADAGVASRRGRPELPWHPVLAAARVGCACGALTCTHYGGQSPRVTPARLREFL